jgi:hypothetical protein
MLMFSSCSNLEFNTDGREPFYVGAQSGSERIVELTKTKDFYLWGLLPKSQDFNLQDETKDQGLYNPSYIILEQSFSFSNALFAIITLGMYTPIDYKLTILSKGESK